MRAQCHARCAEFLIMCNAIGGSGHQLRLLPDRRKASDWTKVLCARKEHIHARTLTLPESNRPWNQQSCLQSILLDFLSELR